MTFAVSTPPTSEPTPPTSEPSPDTTTTTMVVVTLPPDDGTLTDYQGSVLLVLCLTMAGVWSLVGRQWTSGRSH